MNEPNPLVAATTANWIPEHCLSCRRLDNGTLYICEYHEGYVEASEEAVSEVARLTRERDAALDGLSALAEYAREQEVESTEMQSFLSGVEERQWHAGRAAAFRNIIGRARQTINAIETGAIHNDQA